LLLCFLLPVALLNLECSHLMNAQEKDPPHFTRNTAVLGSWWWWVEPKEQDRHLDFAAKEGVNEIYYYTTVFTNRTGSFIEKARNRGIRVFLLLDDYNYVWDRSSFVRVMNRFTAYQNRAPENRKFAGLHLDIEPHQHPQFSDNYHTFLQNYMDFIVWVCSRYRNVRDNSTPGITVDLDIATWHYVDVLYKGEETRLYQALIMEADRVFVMAYQDSAKKTHELAKPELEFAKSVNKQIILGAETGRWDEDPEISYYGKGRAYFYEQLYKLHNLVDYDNYGLSIHHISSWYSMDP